MGECPKYDDRDVSCRFCSDSPQYGCQRQVESGWPLVQQIFRQYYRHGFGLQFQSPHRHARREYGFIHFGGNFFDRHRGFESSDDLVRYIQIRVPQHAYMSSAYYDRPGASTMKDKLWRGADLIFDLDADHLVGAGLMTPEEQLDRVKVQVLHLVNEYLHQDLGLDPDKMEFVFSGGRGYHIHCRDERLLSLDARERREIVSYVTGKEVVPENYITQRPYGTDRRGKLLHDPQLPATNAPGWKGRLTRSLVAVIESAISQTRSKGIGQLSQYPKIGHAIAAYVYDTFANPKFGAQRLEKLRQGSTVMFENKTYLTPLLTSVAESSLTAIAAETDEPVTSDVKRLIRLPWTLHGKTGLLVRPLTWAQLQEFDPLRDAVVLHGIDWPPVRVRALKPVRFRLGREQYDLQDQHELCAAAAVYAIGRKMVEVVA